MYIDIYRKIQHSVLIFSRTINFGQKILLFSRIIKFGQSLLLSKKYNRDFEPESRW